jgi:hypothetical protein
MSDPALSRSASRPLPARRFAARGNALASEIAGFEERSMSVRARTGAGTPARPSIGPTEGCVGSQTDDRASIPATRRSTAVCRRRIRCGKGSFSGQVVRPAERSRRPAPTRQSTARKKSAANFCGSQRIENNRFGEIIAPDELNGLQRRIARRVWPSLPTRAASTARRPAHSATPADLVRGKIDEENFPARNTLKTINPEKYSRRFGSSPNGETPCASPARPERL